jgi:hypothetical protein
MYSSCADGQNNSTEVHCPQEGRLNKALHTLQRYVLLRKSNHTRRTIMAKGQQRKNKEVKKPKKKPTPAI